MKERMKNHQSEAGLLMGLAVLFCPLAGADTVYKCVADGKTNFTSTPQSAPGQCQPVDLHVPEPNPVDVSRGMERLHEYDMEKRADAARRRREPDADALRRAEAAEIAKSVAKAPVPSLWGTRSGRGRRRSGGG